jgi:multimeric flavodoxin WrbA
MTNSLVILGTARDESNTLKALTASSHFRDFDLVELHKLNIAPYSYRNPPVDDFLAVAEQMLKAEVIVFATPVYWYAMSGVLKTFFDRLTDLISTSRPIGRGLKGKSTYLFSTGSDDVLPEGFEIPFKKTSEYFGMNFKGSFYVCIK